MRLEKSFATLGRVSDSSVHMNGRVYDYNLGRFLSVDPFIQEPGNSQSMNPYSYIMNNPLAGTDPSGYLSVGGCNLICATDIELINGHIQSFSHTTEKRNGSIGKGSQALYVTTVTVTDDLGRENTKHVTHTGEFDDSMAYDAAVDIVITGGTLRVFLQRANEANARTNVESPPKQMPDLLQSFADGKVKFPNGMNNDQARSTMDTIQEQASEFFGIDSSELTITATEDSILYIRGASSVLVKNDVSAKGIPVVSLERVFDALDVSKQVGKRVNVISGYRGPNYDPKSINHEKYGAIDVYIDGFNSTQTAKALYNSGHFHRVAGYPDSKLQSAHGDNRTNYKGGCFVKWKGDSC